MVQDRTRCACPRLRCDSGLGSSVPSPVPETRGHRGRLCGEGVTLHSHSATSAPRWRLCPGWGEGGPRELDDLGGGARPPLGGV